MLQTFSSCKSKRLQQVLLIFYRLFYPWFRKPNVSIVIDILIIHRISQRRVAQLRNRKSCPMSPLAVQCYMDQFRIIANLQKLKTGVFALILKNYVIGLASVFNKIVDNSHFRKFDIITFWFASEYCPPKRRLFPG